MSQNLIELHLTPEAVANIDAALTTLETELAGLIALTPDQRRELTKMGGKSEAFVRQAVGVLGENPGVLPRNFDLDGYQNDLRMLDTLRPRLVRLARLQERGNDTETALGSDLMTGSLEGYASLSRAGKGEGLDGLRKMLSARFDRSAPKTNAGPTPPAN